MSSTSQRLPVIAVVFLIVLALSAGAQEWPQWRGPTGQGTTTEKNLPTTWDIKTGENIAWKAALPKSDNPYASPIVKNGKVIITLAMAKTREHHVLCFDAITGKPLWDTIVPPGPWNLTDLRGGYAAPTPAADDKNVYVLFGSAVIAAVDFEGKIVWRKELPRYNFDVAIGCSPVLYKETILLQADMLKKESSLIAFDKATGEIKWEAKRPEANFSHTTPTLIDLGGKPQLLIASSDALQGADPENGQVVWSAKAKGDTVSPVFSNGMVYIDSGRGGPAYAFNIAPESRGDITQSAARWNVKNLPEAFGSPVIVEDKLYRLHSPAILKVFNLADGKELSSQRLEGATPAASPIVTADGLIYFASSGKSYVVKAGEKPEIIATNDLADPNYASPAVAGGRIFIKGKNALYAIGAKGK